MKCKWENFQHNKISCTACVMGFPPSMAALARFPPATMRPSHTEAQTSGVFFSLETEHSDGFWTGKASNGQLCNWTGAHRSHGPPQAFPCFSCHSFPLESKLLHPCPVQTAGLVLAKPSCNLFLMAQPEGCLWKRVVNAEKQHKTAPRCSLLLGVWWVDEEFQSSGLIGGEEACAFLCSLWQRPHRPPAPNNTSSPRATYEALPDPLCHYSPWTWGFSGSWDRACFLNPFKFHLGLQLPAFDSM